MKGFIAAVALLVSGLACEAQAQGYAMPAGSWSGQSVPNAGTTSETTQIAPYSYYAAFPSAARQYVGLASTPGAYSSTAHGLGGASGCSSCGGQAGTVSGYGSGSGFGGQDFPFLGQPYGHVYDKYTWNYMAERSASRFNPW